MKVGIKPEGSLSLKRMKENILEVLRAEERNRIHCEIQCKVQDEWETTGKHTYRKEYLDLLSKND